MQTKILNKLRKIDGMSISFHYQNGILIIHKLFTSSVPGYSRFSNLNRWRTQGEIVIFMRWNYSLGLISKKKEKTTNGRIYKHCFITYVHALVGDYSVTVLCYHAVISRLTLKSLSYVILIFFSVLTVMNSLQCSIS